MWSLPWGGETKYLLEHTSAVVGIGWVAYNQVT